MKHQADKGHTESQFNVGDMVFLKIQPYVSERIGSSHMSAPRSNQKLAFKFYGPYSVSERIASVAYKLDLPPSVAIHPVFHVSQLKKVVGSRVAVSSSLPVMRSRLQVPVSTFSSAA
jgi:hypothetical protein